MRLDKLDAVEARFEALTQQLSDPEVTKSQKLLRDLSKEHAELKKVVEVYRELKKVDGHIAGNKELVATERDPEMVAMAADELRGLETRRAELLEQVKLLLLPKDPDDDKNIILEIRA